MTNSTRYNFVRARRLERTLPGDSRLGTWMVTYNRTQFGWGQVPEPAYPKQVIDSEYFAPIPQQIDYLAKAGRVHHYQRIRNSREARQIARKNPDVLQILKRGKKLPTSDKHLELKVAFEYTQQFVDAPSGHIKMPSPGAPILGSHSVPIIGIREASQTFVISNSWGPSWGDHSFGYMPFEFFDAFMIESYAIAEKKPSLPEGNGIIATQWNEPDWLGNHIYGMELYDPREDERIGWSFAVHREGNFEIEELFVKPDYRRRGHGGTLVSMLMVISRSLGADTHAWIPFADVDEENRPALVGIISRLGLGIRRSGTRWAAYKATPAGSQKVSFPFIRTPSRPAALPDEGAELRNVATLRGTVAKFEDPFAPAVPADEWEALR